MRPACRATLQEESERNELVTFECFLEIGPRALLDARHAGQVERAVAAALVGRRHAGALHLVRRGEVCHDLGEPGAFRERHLLGDLRARHAVLVPLRRVRVRVNPCG